MQASVPTWVRVKWPPRTRTATHTPCRGTPSECLFFVGIYLFLNGNNGVSTAFCGGQWAISFHHVSLSWVQTPLPSSIHPRDLGSNPSALVFLQSGTWVQTPLPSSSFNPVSAGRRYHSPPPLCTCPSRCVTPTHPLFTTGVVGFACAPPIPPLPPRGRVCPHPSGFRWGGGPI